MAPRVDLIASDPALPASARRLMAQLVMGDTPVVDPSPFRFSRFAERPRPTPSPLT